MKTHQALAGEKLAGLYGPLCRGVKCLQFASEMSCQVLETCRWLNLSPCFDTAEAESIGKVLVKLFASSGSAAINYVARVLTRVTLCCHSLREMTLMSVSLECNGRPLCCSSCQQQERKDGQIRLIKLRSGIHKTVV